MCISLYVNAISKEKPNKYWILVSDMMLKHAEGNVLSAKYSEMHQKEDWLMDRKMGRHW